MKFAYAARDREVAFIIRLLTIFGVVEQRQMRLLFNHLSWTSAQATLRLFYRSLLRPRIMT